MATAADPKPSEENTAQKIQRNRLSQRGKSQMSRLPTVSQSEEKGIKIYTEKRSIHLMLNLSFQRRDVWILLFLAGLVILLMASSINEEIRQILIDALIGLLQLLIFGEHKNT